MTRNQHAERVELIRTGFSRFGALEERITALEMRQARVEEIMSEIRLHLGAMALAA